ncbi:cobalamin biosynthesis protein [Streptomyces hydrogenans]|uniref:cobalamin biosynthesis protein n=1 Tax=Streptomyces hydrogenans TaxID=1873719 RepID=UPI00278C8318|nr:cobalamin biosynthesis protein [Streptomyces hydrogenans]
MPGVHIGVGARSGTPAEEILALVRSALAELSGPAGPAGAGHAAPRDRDDRP